MRRFQFPFASLLELRRNARDLLRRELADLVVQLDKLSVQRDGVAAERFAQFEELRTMSQDKYLQVEASLSRRGYADSLAADMTCIDDQRRCAVEKIGLCRSALLRADQQVESLEKLAQKQLVEYVSREERHEMARDEETWQALRATERLS
jgi:flagellar protein FliJ